MKKIKFKHEHDLPDKVIGISSAYSDFQIAWTLNRILQTDLSKGSDLALKSQTSEANQTFNFSVFSYDDQDENCFFLVSNKNKNTFLSSKYKNIDFFFIINSSEKIETISKLLLNQRFINGNFILETDPILKKVLAKLIEK